MNTLEQLEIIKKRIQEYYGMSFETDQEDYKHNKFLKNQLKQLIIELENGNPIVTNEVLLVLAESTGCADDQEIAESIIDDLYTHKYITKTQLDYFYDNIGTARWV